MNWKLSTTQRIRMGLSFVVVFVLILATNLIDKNHFEVVRDNLNTVYEDRLVAKSYLYKIHRQVQQKEKLYENLETSDFKALNVAINDSIEALIGNFSETRLTSSEAERFKTLQQNLVALNQFEGKIFANDDLSPESPYPTDSEKYFVAIYEDLDELFEIQLKEGQRVVRSSNSKIETSDFISKLEIGFLVFIGIIIQMVIFLKPIK